MIFLPTLVWPHAGNLDTFAIFIADLKTAFTQIETAVKIMGPNKNNK